MLTQTQNKQVFVAAADFSYTKEGIKRLSLVIQATLYFRRWSARELARQAKVAPATASRYAKGTIEKPQAEVIRSIAPFILKAVKFVSSQEVEIDKAETYTNWEELAFVASDDFILQEKIKVKMGTEVLQKLIINEMHRLGMGEKDFAREVMLPTSTIKSILSRGVVPGNVEDALGMLATTLTNPETGEAFVDVSLLADYCKIRI